MLKHFAMLALSFAAFSAVAKADTINLNSLTLTDGVGSGSGTMSYDSTSGMITGTQITWTLLGEGDYVFIGTPTSQSAHDTYYEIDFADSNGLTFTLDLGDDICTLANPCGSGVSNLDGLALADGTLAVPPTSVTPEPSSLVLLGTGVLGVAGALRRKLSM